MANATLYPPGAITRSDVETMWRILHSIESTIAPVERPLHLVHSAGIPPEIIQLARKLKRTREQRTRIFPQEILGEPGWDIMLAAYIAEGEGYRLRIGDVCNESGVAATTSLRWINLMIDHGMIMKAPHPTDARSSYIKATDTLMARMTEFLRQVYSNHLEPRPASRDHWPG